MIRTVSAAETAPTTYAFPIQARRLRLRAGLRTAVDGLDLALGDGVHGLLGPNGAGKTTLLRALATLVRPTGGELEILGEAVHAGGGGDLRAVRLGLGYLPQDFGYYRWYTLREFVEYVAWLREVPAGDIPDAAQRAIDRVDLAARAGSRLRSLSGGMLRRVGIAQAIVSEPRVLLLDEPTVGLDLEQRARALALLRDLGSDTCVVLATHLADDVAGACTDVALLDGGRLAFQGTVAELTAAAGDADPDLHPGGNDVERGYAVLLRRHRAVGGQG
ncbi:ATP-binding cassette domain-containing protein [Solwaraspora sp. WMMD1047]|uniref:ATP-binding cassette domain-containing protein n=1 Tax=Solwaraspora sp. WMMD1047 TaxID=3016102 RepID=UPI0024166B17|nr:ATP-binding cassette domain-containing protein [Solwaraspora sp. WMMD1047]MDG4830315.1 ATP-binding cassette domain-containing protein [Solwaraspora sp. WMMD1047]